MTGANYDDSENSSACRICRILALQPEERLVSDEVLVESKNFFVIPALGPIVAGYVLIVPRHHRTSMAQVPLDQWNELESLLSDLREILTSCFSVGIVIMEHGTTGVGDGGACIDHAHWHVVPTTADLLPHFHSLARKDNASLHRIKSVRELRLHCDSAYLFLLTENEALIANIYNPPRQFFRMALAVALGQHGEWDWRTHPNDERLTRTVHTIRSFLVASESL